MWIETIDHIQITYPPDVAHDMHFFYGDVLGLPKLTKPEALQVSGGVWYLLGEIQLGVICINPPKGGISKFIAGGY